MNVRKLVAPFGIAVRAYALAMRPRPLRRGATYEEVRRPYPGRDLVSGGERSAKRY